MFEELLASLGRSLSAHEIPYMVIGGQAVLLHGEPRLTQDIDITVGVSPSRLDDILQVAAEVKLESLVDPESFVRETLVLPCAHEPTGVRVDLIFSFSEYETAAMSRTIGVNLQDVAVQFASAEDLIVHKMIAGRPRDLEDIRGILLKQNKVELTYIKLWLQRFSETINRPLWEDFESLSNDL